ncbi:MAG TPA: hypothetical protein VD902_08280 [Symbiobacteriaceae bacterium]|nr:hypothetical protein [Symbiobacteriaceae bacterium]
MTLKTGPIGNPILWAAVGLGALAFGTKRGRKIMRTGAVGVVIGCMTVVDIAKKQSVVLKGGWQDLVAEAKAKKHAPNRVEAQPVEA